MRLPQALRLAESAAIDFAFLDVNLDGSMSFPVAEILGSRGVPFVFLTGYGSAGVDPAYRARGMVVKKPFELADLKGAIERMAGP